MCGANVLNVCMRLILDSINNEMRNWILNNGIQRATIHSHHSLLYTTHTMKSHITPEQHTSTHTYTHFAGCKQTLLNMYLPVLPYLPQTENR